MSGKSVVGSVLISVILMSAIVYFGLPYIFPNNENILIQSKYEEFNSDAYIFDDETTNLQLMTDTQMNITIQENSRIIVTFSAVVILTLGPFFTNIAKFNISLKVDGVGHSNTTIAYHDNTQTLGGSDFIQFTDSIYLNYATGPLPAGTYTIGVYWISSIDAPGGSNSLSANYKTGYDTFNYPRSLLIQELAS